MNTICGVIVGGREMTNNEELANLGQTCTKLGYSNYDSAQDSSFTFFEICFMVPVWISSSLLDGDSIYI
jgi:hypothetical protein